MLDELILPFGSERHCTASIGWLGTIQLTEAPCITRVVIHRRMPVQPGYGSACYLTGCYGVQDIGGLGVVLLRGRDDAKRLFELPTLLSPRLHIEPVIQAQCSGQLFGGSRHICLH